jgi:hypothetical protein
MRRLIAISSGVLAAAPRAAALLARPPDTQAQDHGCPAAKRLPCGRRPRVVGLEVQDEDGRPLRGPERAEHGSVTECQSAPSK